MRIRTRLLGHLPGIAATVAAFSACVLAMSLMSPVARAAPSWQQVGGDGFVLLTPDSPKEALAAARDVQTFFAQLSGVLTVDPARLPPLTLVMLRHGRAFRPYRPLNASGKPQDVAGFFARDAGWAMAALAERWGNGDGRRVLQHEGVHWFLSGLDFERPLWLEEGLAEVFSTFELKKGEGLLGEPIVEHVVYLGEEPCLPVERLLLVTASDPLYNESSRAGRFYASAWLFVHYLIFGEHEIPRSALNTFLTEERRSGDRGAAFRTAFGMDYAGMNSALRAYLERGRFRRYVGPAKSDSALQARPAAPAEVELALGRIALLGDNFAQAERHLVRLRELTPDAPQPEELAGHLARARRDPAAMQSAFARAAERGSRDVGVYFWPAEQIRGSAGDDDTASSWGGTGTLTQDDLRRAANLYKRAINLQPTWRPAYEAFAAVIPALFSPQPHDRPFLEQGLRVFPHNGHLSAALAVLDYRQDREDEAIDRLSDVLARAEAREETELARFARTLLTDWRSLRLLRAIQAALQDGSVDAARELVALCEQEGVPLHRRHEFMQLRRALERLETAPAAAPR